tara:strand:+ start:227 stop:1360 length:1134 start_codon:yes stop_codon:yes gene_type:complete
MEMEEYINAYYGGTLGIAKRYGIEKGDNDFTVANQANAFNVVYGAKVYNQLNTKSEVAKLLKKEPWTQSGWRVMTTRPVDDGGNADFAAGTAEGGAFGDTTAPTLVEVEATLKEIVTPYEISTKAELLSDADDGLKGLAAFMRKEMGDAHVFGMDQMLLATAETVAGNNVESLDRVTMSDAAANATLSSRADIDMYNIDRSAQSWADATVSHNSGSDRALTTAMLDTLIEGVMTNGANYADLVFLTGHDTYMNIQQLLTKGGDGGAATILRYDAAQEGAASQNGVLGQAGLNYDSRVGSYNGIPIFVSQHVAKDTVSRIHLLDLPQFALRVAAPTTYVANDNLAITQALTKQFALITAMELITYRFNTSGSVRDLNA